MTGPVDLAPRRSRAEGPGAHRARRARSGEAAARASFSGLARLYLLAAVGCWIAVGAVGCAEQEYYKPKGWRWKVTPGEVTARKHGMLPNGETASHFEVFVRGMEKRQVGSRKMRSIRVGMNVANNTGEPLSVDSQEAYLVDRTGEVLRCSAMRVSGAKKAFARLKPNAHAILDMYFDLGAERRDLKDFTVHWRYTIGDEPFSQASAFQRDFHGWAD